MVDLAEFASLAKAIAPELNECPMYLLMQPSTMATPPNTFAYAVRGRHIELREHLQSTGTWKGAFGPTIVFCDVPASREEMFGSGIHELAHVLPAFALADVEYTANELAAQIAMLQKFATTDPLEAMEVEPWRGHDAKWIRRVIHLHYRALWQGIPIPLVDLHCAGNWYGLSPVWLYLESLGAEPFRLSAMTFAEIEKTKAPADFINLFCDDVTRWKQREVVNHDLQSST